MVPTSAKKRDKGNISGIVERMIDDIRQREFCYPFSPERHCIVCGAFRLEPDPTGLTCGEDKCLALLWREFSKLETEIETINGILEEKTAKARELDDFLRKIALWFGIDTQGKEIQEILEAINSVIEEKSFGSDWEALQRKLEDIQELGLETEEDWKTLQKEIENIADLLGLKVKKELPSRINPLLFSIKLELKKLLRLLENLQRRLK